jgi:DNA-binding NarL/FixJ family response regulator
VTAPQSIVIVDDEVTLAIVMRTLVLQGWPDAEVSVFTDPLNLVPRLMEIPSGSVVLMDRRLGGADSYGIISTLLAARPDIRVAMLSASLGAEERSRARAAGAFTAYEKPSALGGWRQLLQEVIPGSEAGRSLSPDVDPAVAS